MNLSHRNRQGVVLKLRNNTLHISCCSASYRVTVTAVLSMLDYTLTSTSFELCLLLFNTDVVSIFFVSTVYIYNLI